MTLIKIGYPRNHQFLLFFYRKKVNVVQLDTIENFCNLVSNADTIKNERA